MATASAKATDHRYCITRERRIIADKHASYAMQDAEYGRIKRGMDPAKAKTVTARTKPFAATLTEEQAPHREYSPFTRSIGEVALLRSILELAVEDAGRLGAGRPLPGVNDGPGTRSDAEALRAWAEAPPTSGPFGSLQGLCEVLETLTQTPIDVVRVREKIVGPLRRAFGNHQSRSKPRVVSVRGRVVADNE